MTADARRDEALRLIREAIAEEEAGLASLDGLIAEGWSRGNRSFYVRQLRLHRANKALLAEHHSMNTGDPNRKTCVVCSHRNFPPGQNGPMKWPCPTAERVIAAYLGEPA